MTNVYYKLELELELYPVEPGSSWVMYFDAAPVSARIASPAVGSFSAAFAPHTPAVEGDRSCSIKRIPDALHDSDASLLERPSCLP